MNKITINFLILKYKFNLGEGVETLSSNEGNHYPFSVIFLVYFHFAYLTIISITLFAPLLIFILLV